MGARRDNSGRKEDNQKERRKNRNRRRRLHLIDGIRGLTVVSMILYHAAWDAVYLLDYPWRWYRSSGAFLWQQSICWTFILLSGFCIPMSRKPVRRGILIFAMGALITGVTMVFVPDERVIFGVLTLIGTCMILLGVFEPLLEKLPAWEMLPLNFLFFLLTRSINSGYLGIGPLKLLQLPGSLYSGWVSAYLGFPPAGFRSTDYFSVIPWIFLYHCGYFLCRTFKQAGLFKNRIFKVRIPVADWLGRHSLAVYLLHQPILYLIVLVIQQWG